MVRRAPVGRLELRIRSRRARPLRRSVLIERSTDSRLPSFGQRRIDGTIGRVTSTQTLESPKTADAETGDQLFHYVRKEKVAESAVTGNLVQALCGEVFPVTRVPKPGSPVCQQCKEIYESLRS